jgi:hypothetical protein
MGKRLTRLAARIGDTIDETLYGSDLRTARYHELAIRDLRTEMNLASWPIPAALTPKAEAALDAAPEAQAGPQAEA